MAAGVVEVPAVGGHHQLARVLLGLGRAEPSRGTVGEERALRAQLRRSIPPGAFVVLLSALVSAEPLAHAVRLARSGHAVVVVDTLPPELRGPEATDDALRSVTGVDDARLARLVWRLRLLDREREAHRCAMAGRAGHRLAGARARSTPCCARRPADRAPRGWPADDPQPHLAPRDGRAPSSSPTSSSCSSPAPRCPASCPSPSARSPSPPWWALARPGGLGCVHARGRAGALRDRARRRARRPSCSGRWPRPPASAVVLTHLALTLLGSWPARADLPRATALRWGGQAAALVWVAIGAALLGALATTTPLGWAPWIGAIGLGLIAGTVWQVRVNTRKG